MSDSEELAQCTEVLYAEIFIMHQRTSALTLRGSCASGKGAACILPLRRFFPRQLLNSSFQSSSWSNGRCGGQWAGLQQ